MVETSMTHITRSRVKSTNVSGRWRSRYCYMGQENSSLMNDQSVSTCKSKPQKNVDICSRTYRPLGSYITLRQNYQPEGLSLTSRSNQPATQHRRTGGTVVFTTDPASLNPRNEFSAASCGRLTRTACGVSSLPTTEFYMIESNCMR